LIAFFFFFCSGNPRTYAYAVFAYAEASIGSTLYLGPNYNRLAAYLKAPFDKHDKQQNRKGRDRYAPSDQTSELPSFPFAHLYSDLLQEEDSDFEAETTGSLLHELTIRASEDAQVKLLFLRGQPSAEWLTALGGALMVDPEYFQRHLEFLSTTGRVDYFPLPTLPSASNHIIQLRYYTIGRLVDPSPTPEAIAELRKISQKEMVSYRTNLVKSFDNNNGVGRSIIRDFSIFDSGHWVIEQVISLCVTNSDLGWTGKCTEYVRDYWGGIADHKGTGIAWIDSGDSLGAIEGPWMRHLSKNVFPTIQILPGIALQARENSVKHEARLKSPSTQSASLLHIGYGRHSNRGLMAKDAFYSFHELFRFCAFSQVQFLNMVERNISAESSASIPPERLANHQGNLIYIQESLQNQMARLREDIEAIRTRGAASWPRPADETLEKESVEAAKRLEADYESLLQRADTLVERCRLKVDHLTSRAMLAESNKAIEQAREVTRLTRLAFIFIPLSFITSWFGMNVDPIVDGAPQIWIWVAASVPVLIISIGFLILDSKMVTVPWRRSKIKTETT
jgi:hypothetical protein